MVEIALLVIHYDLPWATLRHPRGERTTDVVVIVPDHDRLVLARPAIFPIDPQVPAVERLDLEGDFVAGLNVEPLAALLVEPVHRCHLDAAGV